MKLQCPMLVVSDLAASRAFYETLLAQEVILDFGANITFNGGFALQTEESWLQFIGKPSSVLKKKPHDMELYFETESFDSFLQQLGTQTVELVHPVQDMPWGQRLIQTGISSRSEKVCRRSSVVFCGRVCPPKKWPRNPSTRLNLSASANPC